MEELVEAVAIPETRPKMILFNGAYIPTSSEYFGFFAASPEDLYQSLAPKI